MSISESSSDGTGRSGAEGGGSEVTEASERSPGTAAAERTIGKIDRIEERIVRIPFVSPFSTSTATWAVKEALLLRIEGDGFTGWGECVADPDPFYAPETTTSASHIIRQFLLPLLESSYRPARARSAARADR